MLAQIIHGIGFTPMFTLGTVYLDENSNPNTGALYLGKLAFLFFLKICFGKYVCLFLFS